MGIPASKEVYPIVFERSGYMYGLVVVLAAARRCKVYFEIWRCTAEAVCGTRFRGKAKR